MIRMIQMQSAEQAKDYHNDALAPSDYYINDQELKGAFHGKIAKRLGIEGEANKQDYDALCENLNPTTLKNLTPRTVTDRTVGYDISFHVPKSVSVLHALSNDDHILEAFRQSVHDTMLDIEADSKARVRKNGKDEDRETGELVWAEFIHQTARPTEDAEPDPHLHCHCFTFNVTWDSFEQTFKAGQFRDIKRDMPYYQARFHKLLADHLVTLGYQICRTKNAFEVVGVPEKVISLFSKRTNEIGQFIRDNNITDAKEKDKVGARTRAKKKKGLTMAQIKQDWRQQIFALGMTDGKAGDPIRHAPGIKPDAIEAAACVDHSLLTSFERASVVHDRRILEKAYRHSIGYSGATIGQITDCFKRDKRIIFVKDGSRLLCTTHEVLAEEKRMVDLANAGKGQLAPLYATAPQLTLTGDQAEAVAHILTCTDRVAIVRGGAGTGKTTMLQEAVNLIERTGKKVSIVAPTANASRGVLRQEGYSHADTVAKLLIDPDLQKTLQDGVLIVDEAGLLGVKDMAALLQLVTDKNARLILCGDTRQHASVVRGDGLRILNTVAGIKAAEVNKIYRQRHECYRKAVEHLAAGNVKAAFELLESFNAIKEIDPANLNKQLVEDYRAAINKGKTALVVSPTHRQGEAVTAEIRKALQDSGVIGTNEISVTRYVNMNFTDAEKTDVRMYQPGLVAQFNQNLTGFPRGSTAQVQEVSGNQVMVTGINGKTLPLPLDKASDFNLYRKTTLQLAVGDTILITRNGFDRKGKRLNNGQTMTVLSIDDADNILFRNTASQVTYCLGKEFGHINYGYVTTSHSSQGKTVDEVFISQPGSTFPATNIKQFYVSVSRARDNVHIYTDDKAALLEHASAMGDRQSATELVSTIKKPLAQSLIIRRRQDYTTTKTATVKPSPQQPVRSHAPKPYI